MPADDDITWGEMWAEEEQERRAAVDAAWAASSASTVEPYPSFAVSSSASAVPHEEREFPPTIAAEPYFGEPSPHQQQPYFELNTEPAVLADDDSRQPPALRIELPAPPPLVLSLNFDPDEPVEKIDWQAPPKPSEDDEDRSFQGEQSWNTTWADGLNRGSRSPTDG